MELNFRDLRADEVMVRFKQHNSKAKPTKGMYLLYKDARCDMRILDETIGSMNWQREHTMFDGKLYCKVSIWDAERRTWIAKDDAGEESKTEQTKGEASDAFKRACFNWGIGRELYTSPKIEIPYESDWEKTNLCHAGLHVKEIEIKDHRITKLVIADKFKVRFSWAAQQVSKPKPQLNRIPYEDLSNRDQYGYKTACRLCSVAEDVNALKTVWNMYQDAAFNGLLVDHIKEIKKEKGWA